MRITWINEGRFWEVAQLKPEMVDILWRSGMLPEFYDRTNQGDVYIYEKDLAVGNLIHKLAENGITLEVITHE